MYDLLAVPELRLRGERWDNSAATIVEFVSRLNGTPGPARLALGWWTEKSSDGFVPKTDWALAWKLDDILAHTAQWGAFSSCALLCQNQALLYWSAASTDVRRRGAFVPKTHLAIILTGVSEKTSAREEALALLAAPHEASGYRFPPDVVPGPDYLNIEVRFTINGFSIEHLPETLGTIRTLCAAYDADVSGGTVLLPQGARDANTIEVFSLFRRRAEIAKLFGLEDGEQETPTECLPLFEKTFTVRTIGNDIDVVLALRPGATALTPAP